MIEIIYRLQKETDTLREEVAALEKKLESRELHLSELGSIAEAAMELNGVFSAAQAAAGQYTGEAQRMRDEAERVLEDARKQAAEIISSAEKQRIFTAAACETWESGKA